MNVWKEVGQEPEMGESEYMTVKGMKVGLHDFF